MTSTSSTQPSTSRPITWDDLSFWKSPTWGTIQRALKKTPDLVTPKPNEIFKALALTPLSKVKVVLMAPEAYCNGDVASGLAFSWKKTGVHKDFETAPVPFHALMLELSRNMGIKPPNHGDLSKWARQGVLLWNATPTTLKGIPNAHMLLGWQELSTEIVEAVYAENPNALFCFFGSSRRHMNILPDSVPVLELPMPNLIDGRSTIEGCNLFSTINRALRATGQRKINWKV